MGGHCSVCFFCACVCYLYMAFAAIFPALIPLIYDMRCVCRRGSPQRSFASLVLIGCPAAVGGALPPKAPVAISWQSSGLRRPLLSARFTVPKLSVVKEMIQRLQELRHMDQVQRAYALNCGEGATVSYEIQIRVLREFGLPDGAAELLQVRGAATGLWGWGCGGAGSVWGL